MLGGQLHACTVLVLQYSVKLLAVAEQSSIRRPRDSQCGNCSSIWSGRGSSDLPRGAAVCAETGDPGGQNPIRERHPPPAHLHASSMPHRLPF